MSNSYQNKLCSGIEKLAGATDAAKNEVVQQPTVKESSIIIHAKIELCFNDLCAIARCIQGEVNSSVKQHLKYDDLSVSDVLKYIIEDLNDVINVINSIGKQVG